MSTEKVRDRGREWEVHFFGLPERITFKDIKDVPYVDYRNGLYQAIELQRRRFKINPRKPTAPVTRSLMECVEEFLRLQNIRKGKLYLYCSLGTSLDFHHGVDGFFVLKDKVVTFDLTASMDGKDRRKADVVIPRNRCKNHEMWRIAKEIAFNLS